jgi:hypothetical protein
MSFGREGLSARDSAGPSIAGRRRTGARGSASFSVFRACRIALQYRCLARGERIAVNASRYFQALLRRRRTMKQDPGF